MTIVEAKTKRCPFADQTISVALCHTTECIAWRFNKQYLDKPQGSHALVSPRFIGYSQTDGYCERLSK